MRRHSVGHAVDRGMPNASTLHVDDLRSGDLLFFARPSFIQRFSGYVGDDFRGVAVFDRVDGQPVMHLCGRTNGFETRRLTDVIDAYDRIAVGRAPRCHCTSSMLTELQSMLAERNTYPTTALLPAFLLSWAREIDRGVGSLLARAVVVPLVLADAALRGSLRCRTNRFMCSTWVAAGQPAVCPQHRLTYRLGQTKPGDGSDRTARTGLEGWLDRTLARWYLTPSDLWRAMPDGRRAELTTPSSAAAQPTPVAVERS